MQIWQRTMKCATQELDGGSHRHLQSTLTCMYINEAFPWICADGFFMTVDSLLTSCSEEDIEVYMIIYVLLCNVFPIERRGR